VFLDPQGQEGIAKRGHRGYIGGAWEEIGQLQFDFLVSRGMKPDSYLLDIACGCLRLGVKAIPYLQTGHYLGIEKEAALVTAGLELELDQQVRREKQPNIVVSSAFEFEKLGHLADMAIAQSLFTHLPPDLISLCFEKLYPNLGCGGTFYATYFEVDKRTRNPSKPHDHGCFAYTRDEMLSFGERAGFKSNYIGDWNHPVQQVMVEYVRE
jgi:hypothetical protein